MKRIPPSGRPNDVRRYASGQPPALHRQLGVTTLTISLLLLLGVTAIVLTVARTGIMEERIVNNDYRAKEASEAAQGGVEYGLAWLSEQPVVNTQAIIGTVKKPIPLTLNNLSTAFPSPICQLTSFLDPTNLTTTLSAEIQQKLTEAKTVISGLINPTASQLETALRAVKLTIELPACQPDPQPSGIASANGDTFNIAVSYRMNLEISLGDVLTNVVSTNLLTDFLSGALVTAINGLISNVSGVITALPSIPATALYIQAVSTATAQSDPSIQAVAEQYTLAQPANILSQEFFGVNVPPIVLNGCLSGITGNPEVYPDRAGLAYLATSQDPNGIAVALGVPVGSCINPGHLDTNSGIPVHADFSSSWDFAFNIPLATAKAMAYTAGTVYADNNNIPTAGPARLPTFYVVTDTKNLNGGKTYGSPTNPVILIFDSAAGCPKVNGGVTIYGVIYFEQPDACKANGWGGADVYGAVLFEGDVTKITANTQFRHHTFGSPDHTGPLDFLNSTAFAGKLPGTWKDF